MEPGKIGGVTAPEALLGMGMLGGEWAAIVQVVAAAYRRTGSRERVAVRAGEQVAERLHAAGLSGADALEQARGLAALLL